MTTVTISLDGISKQICFGVNDKPNYRVAIIKSLFDIPPDAEIQLYNSSGAVTSLNNLTATTYNLHTSKCLNVKRITQPLTAVGKSKVLPVVLPICNLRIEDNSFHPSHPKWESLLLKIGGFKYASYEDLLALIHCSIDFQLVKQNGAVTLEARYLTDFGIQCSNTKEVQY